MPANANLGPETGPQLAEMTRRLLARVRERLAEFVKDNDFIYHQPVPNDAALPAVPKLPAAKAIPVSELYAGQDIQRIIGPDIFQAIVPMAVTESASLYDEEKAKLVRAETERVEVAVGEMAASLDYLKLPASLHVLRAAWTATTRSSTTTSAPGATTSPPMSPLRPSSTVCAPSAPSWSPRWSAARASWTWRRACARRCGPSTAPTGRSSPARG